MQSSSLTLVLVRHGITDWNEAARLMGRAEIAINLRGRREAEAVAAALNGIPIQRVISSPQRRALQTAEPIAQHLGLSTETDDALDEVWLGRWQGKTWQDLRGDADVQRYLDDPTYTCDALEPAASVRTRVVSFAERLRSSDSRRTVVAVSHGDPLRILVAHCLGLDLAAYRRLEIGNGSITVLRLGHRGNRLLVLNWSPVDGVQRVIV